MAVLIENPPDLVQEQVLDPTAQTRQLSGDSRNVALVEVNHRETDGAFVAEAVGVVASYDSHLRIGYPRPRPRQGLLARR